MKKTLKMAVAASVLTAPAMANVPGVVYNDLAQNMENPLYMPGRNMFYSKLSNGLMLKVADSSQAHKDKNHDGKVEFPIIRIQEEMGYGITDRWSVHGSVQYTHDDDIGRTGLSAGRIGTTYRLLNLSNGFVWDIYGDVHLGGLGQMRGQYNIEGKKVPDAMAAGIIAQANGDKTAPGAYSLSGATGVIDYDNYSNGMWGYHVGTKFGVKCDKLTTSAFVEVLRTIGDDNSRIRLVGTNVDVLPNSTSTAAILAALHAPSEVAAEFKSTTEVNAGLNAFYQWSSKWSTGAWFRYEHHADQGIKKITTNVQGEILNAIKKGLEKKLSNMKDGFDDYVIGLSAARQITERAQVALYGEYTFDTAHERSQNGTDVKVEAGVRVNFTF